VPADKIGLVNILVIIRYSFFAGLIMHPNNCCFFSLINEISDLKASRQLTFGCRFKSSFPLCFKVYRKLDVNTAECKNLILHKWVGVKCNFIRACKPMVKFEGECLLNKGEITDSEDELFN
jgi:hypothetical protein